MTGIHIFIIILFAAVIILFGTPLVAYLWGRSQATGWIEAFKRSNLTFNKSDDNAKKKKDKETEV